MLLTVYPVDGGSPFRFDPDQFEEYMSIGLADPCSLPRTRTNGEGWFNRTLYRWADTGSCYWCGVQLLVGIDPHRAYPVEPAPADRRPLPGLHGLFLSDADADALVRGCGPYAEQPPGLDMRAVSDLPEWRHRTTLPVLKPGDDPGWHWGEGPPPEPPKLTAAELGGVFAAAAGEVRLAASPDSPGGPKPLLIAEHPPGTERPVVWSKPRKAIRWRRLFGRLRGRDEDAMSDSWWRKAVRSGGKLHGYVHPDDLARREQLNADGHGGGANALTFRVRLDCPRFPWNPESDPAPPA